MMSEFELSTLQDRINTPESLLKHLRQRVLLHGLLKTPQLAGALTGRPPLPVRTHP